MKHVLKYSLIFIALSCKSQVTSIAPLNGLSFENPNGTYFKDLNNELDYYVGKWEGTLNNKKYIFEFVKFTQHLRSYDGTTNGSYYYEDEILGKLKVIDLLTNQVLYDNLNVTNYDDYLILGLAKKNGMFSFLYQDKAEKCYLHLRRINGQPNQLTYCYFTLQSYRDNECLNYQNIYDIPIFLPKTDLILTKQ
ncbi:MULTISPECIES: DUF6705 family protein [Flavobacterium]|uniref:DUF6705 domain-containing protein n=1 Tax=Flavobacterium hankyongi TaxID=1176532 RepID=A0ABP9A9P4_9FLAO|nr:DUF6705 family protein [Flavobacterium sp. N1846]